MSKKTKFYKKVENKFIEVKDFASELTEKQRQQISIIENKKSPINTVCTAALLMGAREGIDGEAESVNLEVEGTFTDGRYKCKMAITWEKVSDVE